MEKKLEKIKELVKELKTEHGLHEDDIIKYIKGDVEIPLSIFKNNELSALETIVKHLREDFSFKINEIAGLLHRSNKTIWATYNKSRQKMNEKLIIKESGLIPITIFGPRLLSISETLVEFLKEEHKMNYHEIAVALNRDDRTIWTMHKRAIMKRKM